jgi:hypothetical protein
MVQEQKAYICSVCKKKKRINIREGHGDTVWGNWVDDD